MTQEASPKRKALVIVYTGDGKGKTSSALGVLFRAWGRGWNCIVLQFIKSTTSNYGEHKAAKKLGIEIVPLGDGFTWLSKDIEHDKELAQQCWAICLEKINSGQYDLIVLDEMTYPLSYGWLSMDEVLEAFRNRPAKTNIIITGRDAPQELVEFADLVTEMREIKHPYQVGLKAQPGIDF